MSDRPSPSEPLSGTTITFCTRCLMPSSRPRISFDSEGVCNACRWAETKKEVDWERRKEEFLDLVSDLRNPKSPYDCIVPTSGGKDSGAIAHHLKYDLGLNPLLVRYTPMLPTHIGEHNIEALCRAGFDKIEHRLNQKVQRHLSRRFFIERGNPDIHRAAAINAIPITESLNRSIPLVVFAEHGESEYGGHVLSQEHTRKRDLSEVLEHQVGDHPSNWLDEEVGEQDIAPYLIPDEAAEYTQAVYYAYYFPWNVYTNFLYVHENYGFQPAPYRSCGTFTNYDSLDDMVDDIYYHLQYVKFGFGRASRDASRRIQRGEMTRQEGIQLARLHDHEYPNRFEAQILDYLQMDQLEFQETIDLHRNEEIWGRHENGWYLRFPPR